MILHKTRECLVRIMQIGAKMTYTFISNLAYKIFYIFQVFVNCNIQQLLAFSYIVNVHSSLKKIKFIKNINSTSVHAKDPPEHTWMSHRTFTRAQEGKGKSLTFLITTKGSPKAALLVNRVANRVDEKRAGFTGTTLYRVNKLELRGSSSNSR